MSVAGQNLDTRLLRYRGRPGEENVVALAEDLLAAGRNGDAMDVITTALRGTPDDPAILLMDGRAKLAAGDLLGAQATLLKLARTSPRDKAPFRWLGEVLLKRGDPERAVKVLERAVALDAGDATVQSLLERATRLARVADAAETPAPEVETARRAPASAAPPEERTVIRTDLTEELRNMTRDVDAAAAARLAPSVATSPLAGPPAAPGATDGDFEDEPTNIVMASDLGFAPGPAPGLGRAGEAGSSSGPLPRADRSRVKRTLSFGAAPSEIRPPAPPPGGRLPPPRRPLTSPSAGTSPGAATAPVPPPPKRALGPAPGAAKPISTFSSRGSPDPFAASDEEIDGALGALEAGGPASPLLEAPPPVPAPPSRSVSPEVESDPRPPAPPPVSDLPSPFPPVGADATPLAPEPRRPVPPLAPEDAFPADDGGPDDPFADAVFPSEAPDADLGPGWDDLRPPAVAVSDASDLPLGGAPREDVDGILAMLEAQGLFEPPSGEAATWAKRAEVKATQGGGTRIGLWMGLVWVLAVGLVVAGWFGWQKLLEHRHRQSAELVAQATHEAYRGDHADLVDAERHLREARDLDPHATSGPTLLLFVHAQRALEDGAFEPGFLRPSIAAAEGLEGDDVGAYVEAARAVLAAQEGGHEEARERIRSALTTRPRDPAILYLSGRLQQRLGGDDALAHLEAASEGEQQLNAARIALAEARYDAGAADEAIEQLQAVLSAEPEHLRARLWRAFMTSDSEEPPAALAALALLEEDIAQHGAPTDQVLQQLTKARLLRRQGNGEAAGEAVDAALGAGASEPRLLALVAVEARAAVRMLHAEHAARGAVRGAPSNVDFRKLLADIQLDRRDGRGALATLGELSADDPDVLEMRAAAALLVGTQEALTAAAEGLDAYVAATEEPSLSLRALRIRTHVRLGGAREMIEDARTLAQEAPGDPSAALALGEAALRVFDAATAVDALAQVVAASPDDPEGHYLLGRARRMAADGEGAEQSLRRAVQLTPEHTEAKLALGGLLLDLGDYRAADELYATLARSSRSASGQAVTVAGRLGRVEALIGLGSLDDAMVQLEALQPDARESPLARVTAARLALARGQAGEALTSLRSLASADGASASVLALYADALLAASQTEPAAEAYARAVADDAGLPEALLGQAELAVRSERSDDALEILARAATALTSRIRPPTMHARMHLLSGRALLLAGRGEAENARVALRRAAEIEGVPPEVHFFLGEALAGDNSPEARASYERYLEVAAEGPYAARARRAVR